MEGLRIQSFAFPRDIQELTVAVGPDKTARFVAREVCGLLGLKNPRASVGLLDPDERCDIPVIDSMGRSQVLNGITESGLYHLAFISRKPEARRFRRWVTAEVLPAIRRTGEYGGASVSAVGADHVTLSDAAELVRVLGRQVAEGSGSDRERMGVFTRRQVTTLAREAGLLVDIVGAVGGADLEPGAARKLGGALKAVRGEPVVVVSADGRRWRSVLQRGHCNQGSNYSVTAVNGVV
jgi:prophage antirepressor-like protein